MTLSPGGLVAGVAPLAVAERSGVVESVHHGVGVVVRPDGSRRAALGDPGVSIYPRSSLKPLQAAALADLGLDVPLDLLAIVCSSHDGEVRHVDAVRRLLDAFDLTEQHLRNTAAYPLATSARESMVAAGEPPSAIRMNCSGKHAGMLATCRVNGWPLDDYLDPDHPVQHGITEAIRARGVRIDGMGVDGCGAPAHVVPIDRLAAALGTLAGSAVHRAMTTHPVLVGGPDRTDTVWMRAVSGLMAKEGAAGVLSFALADGTAGVVKVADGSGLARQAVMPQVLRHAGVDLAAHGPTLDSTAVPVLGHGRPVGEMRALEWTVLDGVPCADRERGDTD